MENNYIGFVYLWINKINGKMYIGSHCGDESDGYFASGIIINRAKEKYGIENFERKILYFEYESEEKLRQTETSYINEYMQKFNSDVLYNMHYHGNGSNYGKKISNATREKLSIAKKKYYAENPDAKDKHSKILKEKWKNDSKYREAIISKRQTNEYREAARKRNLGYKNPMYGHKMTDEQKAKIKSSMMGNKNHFFGKTHTTETKKRLSEKAQMRIGSLNPASKSVKIDDVIYQSIKEAMIKLNVSRKKIKELATCI